MRSHHQRVQWKKAERWFLPRLQPREDQPRGQSPHLDGDRQNSQCVQPGCPGKGGQAVPAHRSGGTLCMNSLRAAEAVKVLENSQRDLNIAFMNEMALICERLDISVYEVLEGMNTKWNALHFRPGLVGGHCIGVDPYYIAQSANEAGYYPELILAARRVNEQVPISFADRLVRELVRRERGKTLQQLSFLILGATFKENVPDTRNTKVVNFYYRLKEYGLNLEIFDPWADTSIFEEDYGIRLLRGLSAEQVAADFDVIVLAVGHRDFEELPFARWRTAGKYIFDLKGILPQESVSLRL